MSIMITFKDIIWIIIFGLCILWILIWIIFNIIRNWFGKKFQKNCFECKHYKLHDVASYGGVCWYKCGIKPEIERRHDFNDKVEYCSCKEFKEKGRG